MLRFWIADRVVRFRIVIWRPQCRSNLRIVGIFITATDEARVLLAYMKRIHILMLRQVDSRAVEEDILPYVHSFSSAATVKN